MQPRITTIQRANNSLERTALRAAAQFGAVSLRTSA